MSPDELSRALALMASFLPSALRARFLGLFPEPFHQVALQQVETVQDVPLAQLSVVEQVLVQDLEAQFGDSDAAAEAEALPLRFADVLALVLHKAGVKKGADIVRRLPESLQSEVLHMIAAYSWSVWERRLGATELAFLTAIQNALEIQDFDASPELVGEMLHAIQNPADVRRNLTYMYEKEPDSTAHIQNYLFGFESLVRLPDRELQHVLNGVDHWDLILAMRNAPANLRRKVLGNLSQRRVAMFEDDEAVLEEVDAAQVEMLQHQIMDRARLLYEAGELHTYLGSIDGQKGDLAGDVKETVTLPGGGKKQIITHNKKSKRQYGAGVLMIGLVLLLGAGAGYVLQHVSKDEPSAGKGKASFGTPQADNSAVRDDKKGSKSHSRPLAQAAVVSGKALLMSGESIRPLDAAELQAGDRIQTDQQGRARVSLSDESGELQVEPESEVEIATETRGEPGPPRLDLRVGNIWVQVKDPALVVTSPLAEITASEGAMYHLRITLNATTEVSVHTGTVWVQANEGKGLHVLGAGERLKLDSNGDVDRDRHFETSQWMDDAQ